LILVGEVRGDAQAPFAANTHALDSILQTGNCAAFSDAEGVVLILLNLLTMVKEEVVSDLNPRSSSGGSARTELDVFVFDAAATALH
jgi:hypothetical protein